MERKKFGLDGNYFTNENKRFSIFLEEKKQHRSITSSQKEILLDLAFHRQVSSIYFIREWLTRECTVFLYIYFLIGDGNSSIQLRKSLKNIPHEERITIDNWVDWKFLHLRELFECFVDIRYEIYLTYFCQMVRKWDRSTCIVVALLGDQVGQMIARILGIADSISHTIKPMYNIGIELNANADGTLQKKLLCV